MKKKILILTASFGAGHNSASRAIKKYIEDDVNNDYEVDIKDFVDISVPKLNKSMVKCYEYQTKYFPIFYNMCYYTKKVLDSRYDTSYRMYIDNLKKYIEINKPDLIISVFPHASATISYIKEKYNISVPLITVVTDVVDSREWIHVGTDMYFVPSESVKLKLIKRKIPSNKIKITGVPVDRKFIESDSDNISYNKEKLLFMGGGRGLFDVSDSFFYWLDRYIENKNKNIKATIVTGTNNKLYKKLKEDKPLKNIRVLGYVSNMPELLSKHDILITKPGGATLFESINAGLPVVVKKPNIGQEIANAKFIDKENIGIVYSNDRELKRIVKSISNINKRDKYNYMFDNISDIKKEINPLEISKYVEEVINSSIGRGA